MNLPDLNEIQAAADIVYNSMSATPQYQWPLLSRHLGLDLWVKHENHTPIGSFKIRGGILFFSRLARDNNRPNGVITATRGNHGQSLAYGARPYGISVTVVVPYGNSIEKNKAMKALGAELIEHGDDFQAAREYAHTLARDRDLQMVSPFNYELVTGVSTYAYELFTAVPDLDTVYVPIGLGSGICGVAAARNAMGLKTRIVGVVSSHAAAYAESFKTGHLVELPATTRLADGMACRKPDENALKLIMDNVEQIVSVSDSEVAAAIRLYFEATHNSSEGSGAAALAGLMRAVSDNSHRHEKVAVILSGCNIDSALFADILSENQ